MMASTNSKADKEELALVQLTLHISKTSDTALPGSAPTEEELVALYENRLDATRRAQLIGYIANSPVTYERWVRCVESLAYLDETNNVDVQATNSVVDEPVNFMKKITNGLSDLVTNRQVIGGGLSTAAVLVLVIYLFPLQRDFDVDRKIESAYTGWGRSLQNEWLALPASKKPEPQYSTERSFFPEPEKKSTVQQVLETGFRITMFNVGGMPFKDFGIENTSLSSVTADEVSGSLTKSQYDVIRQIGQLSALAILQCKINPDSERIAALTPVFAQLRKQLIDNPVNRPAALISATSSDADAIVCPTAQYVVDEIIK